jgi:hypothetical protein
MTEQQAPFMFCGNCGSKTLVGDRFCNTCGQAQRSPSATESVAVPVLLEEPEKPSNESIPAKVAGTPSVDQTGRPGVPVVQLGETPSYCRHSLVMRKGLGADKHHGSDICLGCKLPYGPDVLLVKPTTPADENWLIKNKELVAVGAVLLVLLVIVFSASGSGSSSSSGDTGVNSSGPTASAMGCSDGWTLVKTTNGINIFDCSGTATGKASGHQTLWRFDDAGAQASFMDTMSRAIRPSGHLVFTDTWAVISGSPESYRAAINAGGQDYGS